MGNTSTAPTRHPLSSVALFAGLIGCILSLYLLYHHVEVRGGYQIAKSFCSWSETVDCDAVTISNYSELLGQPLPVWSFLYFLTLIGLSAFATKSERWSERQFVSTFGALSCVGLLSAIVFAAISALVVKKFCIVCFAVHGLNLLVFIIVYGAMKKHQGSYGLGVSEIFGYIRSLGDLQSQRRVGALLAVSSLAFAFLTLFFAPAYLIRNFFEPRKAMAAITQSPKIRVEDFQRSAAAELKLAVDAPLPSRDFARGPADAKITLAVFSDFECPGCRGLASTLETLQEEFSFKVVYKNFPLDQACNPMVKKKFHEYSCAAAEAARCAGIQGENQFWRAHDYLFGGKELTKEMVDALPEKLGLDKPAYAECLSKGAAKDHVASDIEEAKNLKLLGTPSIFVNNHPVLGSDITTLRGVLSTVK